MKRKIYDDLLKWKTAKKKKCLFIQGARQVGKTYIIDEFAAENYPADKIIKMDFIISKDMSQFFEGDLSPEAIMRRVSSDIRFRNVNFKDNPDNPYFIFLDECQECENAIIALKAFSMQSGLYHVVASGSLLGVALKRDFSGSYPVGYVQHLSMYPMDFEEFLWAFGFNSDFIENILRSDSVTASTHEILADLFRKYIVIGGMPEAVRTFVDTHNYDDVYSVQSDLKTGYIQDIRKYGDTEPMKIKIQKCFESIPTHLKEQNKKFMYRRVEKNGRSRMFNDALDWLYDAGLVIYCDNLKTIQKPLSSYIEEEDFKLFLLDTGILMSMFPSEKRYNVLSGSEDIDIGGIYENAVACVIANARKNNNTTYLNMEQQLDLDFVIEIKDVLTIIEVKSGENLKSASLKKYLKMNPDFGGKVIKLSNKLASNEEKVQNKTFYRFALEMQHTNKE